MPKKTALQTAASASPRYHARKPSHALNSQRTARLTQAPIVPGLMQEIALQLVTAAGWPRRLRALRASLRTQRDLLANAIRARMGPASPPSIPSGGLHLWMTLPRSVSDQSVARAALRREVLVNAGRH